MLKLKVSQSEHHRLVEHAKKLLKIKQEAKWEICRIALKVCYIQDKKGSVPKGAYTITAFAEEININRKTLSCWLLDYQSVYLPLGLDDSKMNFNQKVKFSGAISRTRSALFNFNKDRKSAINEVPKNKVRETFQKIINQDPMINRLEDCIKAIKHHHFTIKNGKFNRSHRKMLIEYHEQITQINMLLSTIIKGIK